MAKPSILVTYKLPSSAIEPLAAVGDVEVYRDGVLSKDELIRRVKGKQALVVAALDKIDKDVIDAGSDLKIVSNVAVGYNNLDVPYARSKGIILTNTPDVLTEATANMAMTLILAVTRRIVEGDRVVRRGEWKGFALDFMIGSEIRERQLGIIGLGRIGLAVAEKARHFGMKIAYHNPSRAIGLRLREHVARSAARDLRRRFAPRAAVAADAASDRSHGAVADEAVGLSRSTRRAARSSTRTRWRGRCGEGIIKGAGLDVYEDEPRDSSGPAGARERGAGAAHGERHRRNARRDVRSRRAERRECPQRPASGHADPVNGSGARVPGPVLWSSR